MTKEFINEAFNEYKDLCAKWNELSLASLDLSNKEKWMESLHNQVDEGYKIYMQVKDIIMPKYSLIVSSINDLVIDLQNYIFDLLEEAYYDGFSDYHFLHSIASKLVPIYEERLDYDRLLQSSLIAGYALLEQARFDKSLKESIEYYYQKVIDLKEHFKDFKNERTKYRVLAAYYNLMVVAYDLDIYPSSSLTKTYTDFLELKNNLNYKDLFNTDEELSSTYEYILEHFYESIYQYVDSNTKDVPKDIMDFVIEKVKANYNTTEDDSKEFLLYYKKMLLKEGKTDINSTFLWTYDSYKKYSSTEFDENKDYISFFQTYITYMLKLLNETSFSIDEKEDYFNKIIEEISSFIKIQNKSSKNSNTITQVIQEMIFQPDTFLFFPSLKEKIDFLFQMLIKRHISTYLHSKMVAKFTDLIISKVLYSKPELFIYEASPYKTIEQVKKNQSLIQRTAFYGALLHDIGKFNVLNIISRQNRPLTNNEFNTIKSHTIKGAKNLLIDDDLAQFEDIALYHHKWYNGMGGYPEEYSNLNSKHKIIIDIITMADCLDAATDHLGRNYRKHKTVADVLEEFNKESGTRYNPHIVKLLNEDKELVKNLEYLSSSGREDEYFKAYKEINKN